jgi:hypothetical protein
MIRQITSVVYFYSSELPLEKKSQWQKQLSPALLAPDINIIPLAKYKVAEKPNFSTLNASNPRKY